MRMGGFNGDDDEEDDGKKTKGSKGRKVQPKSKPKLSMTWGSDEDDSESDDGKKSKGSKGRKVQAKTKLDSKSPWWDSDDDSSDSDDDDSDSDDDFMHNSKGKRRANGKGGNNVADFGPGKRYETRNGVLFINGKKTTMKADSMSVKINNIPVEKIKFA